MDSLLYHTEHPKNLIHVSPNKIARVHQLQLQDYAQPASY